MRLDANDLITQSKRSTTWWFLAFAQNSLTSSTSKFLNITNGFFFSKNPTRHAVSSHSSLPPSAAAFVCRAQLPLSKRFRSFMFQQEKNRKATGWFYTEEQRMVKAVWTDKSLYWQTGKERKRKNISAQAQPALFCYHSSPSGLEPTTGASKPQKMLTYLWQ